MKVYAYNVQKTINLLFHQIFFYCLLKIIRILVLLLLLVGKYLWQDMAYRMA